MADELLNAQDLITAKKHDTFHSEVVTGKAGGLSTGANIDYATNVVTGQVQKTLPKILEDLDWSYVGLFADGVTFTDKTDFAVDAVGTQWIYTGSLPFSATAGTVPSEPTYQAVHVKSASAISNANGGSVQDFIDINTFKTVSDMKAFTNHIVGSKVVWQGYYSQSDGGSNCGVVKSGAHTDDGGSIFSIDANTYIEANLKGGRVSALKFGAKFDNLVASAALNTTALQNWLTYIGENSKHGSLPEGVAYHNGLTSVHSTRISGVKTEGPEFGFRTDYKGSVLRNASTSNSSIIVDATSLPFNTGLRCVWDNFTIYGNRNVAGSTAGHNVVLMADTTGEAAFIEGCQFRNIQSIYAKELGWAIQGTVFANDWWACSGSYCGTHGFSRAAPGGSPVTNNLHGCKLFENAQWGVYNDGMIMSLFACNISQNHAGGLLAESGYVESINCDYESNSNISIESRNSSGAGILVTGGKIHKTPGTKPNWVGIRAAAGTSGGIVRDVLFANFTETGDKIFESTGGSLREFGFRLQNVTTGQLTPTDMLAIDRIPNLDFPRIGNVEFAGSGVGRRVATVTFAVPFKVGYTIVGSIRDAFGVNPIGSGISTSNITLASVQLAVDVTADVGPVYVDWVAIGR